MPAAQLKAQVAPQELGAVQPTDWVGLLVDRAVLQAPRVDAQTGQAVQRRARAARLTLQVDGLMDLLLKALFVLPKNQVL